jgi:hypothetical protein
MPKSHIHHQKGSNHMKRMFAVLTIVGVLVALAVPASSMAAVAMTPPHTEFVIQGESTSSRPTNKTSLGSCTIQQIRSITPSVENQKNPVMPATVTPGTCSSGTSISFSGNWTLKPLSMTSMALGDEFGGLTMRFASLPGCKLISVQGYETLTGVWTNRKQSLYSTYAGDPNTRVMLYWTNDSPGTCAKAGKRETSAVYESSGTPGYSLVEGSAPGFGPVRTVEVPN